MMKKKITGELHVMLSRFHGHAGSADCWCEPNRVYVREVNGYPGLTRIIEHNDEVNENHLVTLNRRSLDDDWITKVLNKVRIAPSDPNERSL